jgi:predicted thioesterase
MRVKAWDETKEIGNGTVGRAVVSIGKFMERMKK